MEVQRTANAEATESATLVTYQVCVDHPGEFPFDGTGQTFNDVDEALAHLWQTRRTRPQAYLATVTYQRCDETQFTGLSQEGCFAVGENTKVH